MTTLVVYVTHVWNANADFFAKEGMKKTQGIDYMVVLNGNITHSPLPDYVRVMKRGNVGHDFGGWSAALWSINKRTGRQNFDSYDYYILVNSTVRGPLLPMWAKDHWSRYLIGLLNDQVKLSGVSISVFEGVPHVQSMVLCTDRIGMRLAIETGIFEQSPQPQDKNRVIAYKEVRLSQVIIGSGYNIDCTQKLMSGIDYRIRRFWDRPDPFGDRACLGHLVSPFDSIFVKTIPGSGSELQVVQICRVLPSGSLECDEAPKTTDEAPKTTDETPITDETPKTTDETPKTTDEVLLIGTSDCRLCQQLISLATSMAIAKVRQKNLVMSNSDPILSYIDPDWLDIMTQHQLGLSFNVIEDPSIVSDDCRLPFFDDEPDPELAFLVRQILSSFTFRDHICDQADRIRPERYFQAHLDQPTDLPLSPLVSNVGGDITVTDEAVQLCLIRDCLEFHGCPGPFYYVASAICERYGIACHRL